MALLALDFGTNCGWACRGDDGGLTHGTAKFSPPKSRDVGYRWLIYRRWLAEFKTRLPIETVLYEQTQFTKHGNTSRADQIWGGFEAITTQWCEHHEIPYLSAGPKTVRKVVFGNGNMRKAEVLPALRDYEPIDDNAADAIALLFWYEIAHLGTAPPRDDLLALI